MRKAWTPWAMAVLVIATLGGCGGVDPGFDRHVTAEYAFPFVATSATAKSTCTRTYRATGKVDIDYSESGGFRGQFRVRDHTLDNETISGGCIPDPVYRFNWAGSLVGTAANLTFESTQVNGVSETVSFAGALTAGVISGTMTFAESGTTAQGTIRNGSGTVSVTLR